MTFEQLGAFLKETGYGLSVDWIARLAEYKVAILTDADNTELAEATSPNLETAIEECVDMTTIEIARRK